MSSGCDLFGPEKVSPSERLTYFRNALNMNTRTTTYENIHSSAAMYNQILTTPGWWVSRFPTTNDNYNFTSIVIGSESGGIIPATATFTHSGGANYTATITFKEGDSDVWYILSFYNGGTPIIN